jgi:UDP-N-acetylmuramoylalanine-D-glutamate ligase
MYGKARVGNGVMALAQSLNISIRLLDDSDTDFRAGDYDAVIPTPGVNPNNRAFSANNILSELDFAHRYLPKGFKIIAITGTD